MAVYNIRVDTSENLINDIEAALTAAGILTTKHYASTSSLIVTTTRSNKVLRIVRGTYSRLNTYYGDAWVSGDAVTNQVGVQLYSVNNTLHSCSMIVTANTLVLSTRDTSGIVFFALFGKLDSLANENFCMGVCSQTQNPSHYIRDTTNNQQIDLHTLTGGNLISGTGYYYQVPIPVSNASDVLLASSILDLESLLKPIDHGSTHQVHGDHVVLPGGNAQAVSGYFPASFILENGNSWAPA